MTQTQADRAALERWRGDPALFARDVLGADPWARQIRIMRAVRDHPRVAVKSGHKIGKSFTAAALALWFGSLFPDARVVMTSASARQVRSILWREIKRLVRGSRLPLGTELHDDPGTGIQFPDGREIVGFSTNEPERMAGISGSRVLFIIDEASGVPDEIFEAIEGNRAGGARIVMFSNPTRSVGEFHAAFHGKREFYKTITVSSASTPNCTGIGKPRPGLATPDWIAEKRLEWTEESLLYKVRVEGNFGSKSAQSVISLVHIEAALEAMRGYKEEQYPLIIEERLEIGADVARFGDDESALLARRGNYTHPIETHRNQDGIQLAGHILAMARRLRRPGETPRIKVDVIGVGASVYDQLNHNPELEVIAVNVSESPTVAGYAKLRDQLWFEAGAWLKNGGMIHSDAKLEAELAAPEFAFDLGGRMKVSSKDEMKKVLGRSPDRADALCLAIFNPPELLLLFGRA